MVFKKWINRTDTPTYNSWRAMRGRCSAKRNLKSYYQKGISICERWSSYDLFVEDMGERPKGTSLDRIDNAKGYYKENCRWIDHHGQQNNKTGLSVVEYNGESLTIGQWATKLGLNAKQKNRVYKRHSRYGATSFEELFTPNALVSLRRSKRTNKCAMCLTETSCKWRKHGTQCNTCWHKYYREKLRCGDNSRN